MIDEFQYLFGERDAVTNQAVQLLEDLARRGRSQGIHLVLASQDVSGIQAFWMRPAIFEQFVVRIGLPEAPHDNHREQRRHHAHSRAGTHVVNHRVRCAPGNEILRIPEAGCQGRGGPRCWNTRCTNATPATPGQGPACSTAARAPQARRT